MNRFLDERPVEGLRSGGVILGLISNILLATKMVQTAKLCHVTIRLSDKAETLLAQAKQNVPVLVLVDWDTCESEAFKLLKEFLRASDLNSVPVIGYLSQEKIHLKDEIRRAGCHRVYGKSEFQRDLPNLFARYAQ